MLRRGDLREMLGGRRELLEAAGYARLDHLRIDSRFADRHATPPKVEHLFDDGTRGGGRNRAPPGGEVRVA